MSMDVETGSLEAKPSGAAAKRPVRDAVGLEAKPAVHSERRTVQAAVRLSVIAVLVVAVAAVGLLRGPDSGSDARGAVPPGEEVHIAFAACGDRLEEALVMMKSAVLLSRRHLTFHVFADDALRPRFQASVAAWPERARRRLTLEVYPISYPGVADPDRWQAMFKPCATQRLFMPYLVRGTDRALYVDTDILFLRPPEDVWGLFAGFDDKQLAALAPETETADGGWYKKSAKHPFYPTTGVNTGVMLMDFARMRAAGWRERFVDYRARYTFLPWGDQDLINIYFEELPEQLRVFSCEYDYRTDHCQYGNVCRPAELRGVSILHGNRQSFHTGKQPLFQAIYDAFAAFDLAQDPQALIGPIEAALAAPRGDKDACGKLPQLFGKRLLKELAAAGKEAPPPAEDFDEAARDQLRPFREKGITRGDLDRIGASSRRTVRYQILGGRLYRDAKCPVPDRCAKNERLLARALPGVPDLEMYVNVQEGALSKMDDPLPIFSTSKLPLEHADILYPTWAFAGGAQEPAEAPAERGRRGEALDAIRALVQGPSPPDDPCASRYVLHIESGTADFGLPARLACGKPVLYLEPRWAQFYSYDLVAWRDYLPLNYDAADAARELAMLDAHDGMAKQIAAAGQAFARERLTPERVTRYWTRLLVEYAALQRFTPQRDERLIAIPVAGE